MATHHLSRINEDIQRELSALLRTMKDPRLHGGLISIVRTETAGDLGSCKVYVSVLNPEDKKQVMSGLRSASGYLRRELGRRLSLRKSPELAFIADESIGRGAEILRILEELDVPADEEAQPEEE